MEFDQVPRIPAHHLHGATLQDGLRLWTVAVAREIELALRALGE